MTALSIDTEPNTPDDDQYPSRPASATSDYGGSQDRVGETNGIVWAASSAKDGVKIIKKNPASAPTAQNVGIIKRRGETPKTGVAAAISSPRSRIMSFDTNRNTFSRSSFRVPNVPRASNTSFVGNPKPAKIEPPKFAKPSFPGPGVAKSSRMAHLQQAKAINLSYSELPKPPKSESEKMKELMAGHSKIMNLMAKRKNHIKKVVSSIKSKKPEDEVLSEAASQDESHVLATLLYRYKDQPNAYSLNFAASILPKLQSILRHPNSDYVDLGLYTLEILVLNFGNTIRQGVDANASVIGTNIAAEQRQERCEKCRKALMDLQLTSAFIVGRMSAEQKLKFNALLPILEEVTS
uniref:Katanin p80 subunit C-terminal domain-containing protein n=1 Tax=Acrobeloides nanus TaxID=290746 RepID=A0A914BW65_9BILA